MALLKRNTQPATPAPVVVKTLVEALPAYADIEAKIAELKASRSALNREHVDLLDRLGRYNPLVNDGGRAERVAELLGEEPPETAGAHRRIGEILKETKAIDAAMSTLEGRRAAARMEASARVCDDIRPTY